jgi:hypothetical protein
MKKAYIISFDQIVDSFNLQNIIDSLLKSGHIKSWCKYLSNAYIVITSLSAVDLNKYIGDRIDPTTRKYIVLEINFDNYNGWMPNETWVWIRNEKEKLSNPFI